MYNIGINQVDELARRLQPYYSRFNVTGRLLFTGHSHQAWPDVAMNGYEEAFAVAADEVDKKWETVFEQVEVLRNYLRNFYNDPDGRYCLGQNVHQLMVSWLSALPLMKKPRIITTNGEFYSMERQLKRLEEEGLEVVRLTAEPNAEFAAQLETELQRKPAAAVMLSRIFFGSGLIFSHLQETAKVCRKYNVPLLVDDYHGTNVVPLDFKAGDLEDIFILIGGYKYLQWGEGNCFLRFPTNCELRPAITGWFAAFDTLEDPPSPKVRYTDPNQRFGSATFDGVSQFRAAKVARFFEKQGLTPDRLRQQYRSQVQYLMERFGESRLESYGVRLRHRHPAERRGGFLALKTANARKIKERLMEEDIFTDARGDTLRLGPAPYITTKQMDQLMERLEEVAQSVAD